MNYRKVDEPSESKSEENEKTENCVILVNSSFKEGMKSTQSGD